MPGRITRIVVTQLDPDADHPDPWRVEWINGRDELRQHHDSEAAAQRHVRGLLRELASGVTRDQALTVVRRE
ncbi:hypothetical protein [Mycobacterium sp. NAZ190054]|uniref:hypothetical protein n=1 Tax=Mycobacterium sp. NAZ190054 TaxID=1747766 RepID=UPI0007926594|nr:hypothetical protein [Mycobacterium sp. NAZ190054]KWX66543.1 hypothetical protein ASJ79_25125 [Mycobacterium sp. NAZ190054]